MVYLSGGPSHIDMYDMKPDAPAEIRGEFKPIKTNVPGIEICELMPLQAKIADKFADPPRRAHASATHTGNEFFSGFACEQGKPDAVPTRNARLRLASSAGVPAQRRACRRTSACTTTPTCGTARPTSASATTRSAPPGERQPGSATCARLPASPSTAWPDRKTLLRSFDRPPPRPRRRATAFDGDGRLQRRRRWTSITSGKVRDAFDLSKEPTSFERVRRRAGRLRLRAGPDVPAGPPAGRGRRPGRDRRRSAAGTRTTKNFIDAAASSCRSLDRASARAGHRPATSAAWTRT